MYLTTTDVVAIIIALITSSGVMILSIVQNRRLLMQNRNLRKVIKILQMTKKEESKWVM